MLGKGLGDRKVVEVVGSHVGRTNLPGFKGVNGEIRGEGG